MTDYNGVGIVIFHPDMRSVLMICDSRSRKWSFPKGRVEESDAYPLATGIREVEEETGFIHLHDYRVDPIKKGIYGNYLLYEGLSLRDTLVCDYKLDEYVEQISWIPIENVSKLDKNYTSWQFSVSRGWE